MESDGRLLNEFLNKFLKTLFNRYSDVNELYRLAEISARSDILRSAFIKRLATFYAAEQENYSLTGNISDCLRIRNIIDEFTRIYRPYLTCDDISDAFDVFSTFNDTNYQKYLMYDVLTYFVFKLLDDIKDRCSSDSLKHLIDNMILYGTSNIVLEYLLTLLPDDTFKTEYIKLNRYEFPTTATGTYESLLDEDV